MFQLVTAAAQDIQFAVPSQEDGFPTLGARAWDMSEFQGYQFWEVDLCHVTGKSQVDIMWPVEVLLRQMG
jgi:hypothetical protein